MGQVFIVSTGGIYLTTTKNSLNSTFKWAELSSPSLSNGWGVRVPKGIEPSPLSLRIISLSQSAQQPERFLPFRRKLPSKMKTSYPTDIERDY